MNFGQPNKQGPVGANLENRGIETQLVQIIIFLFSESCRVICD
jgi:hypothetical protein